MSSNGDRSGEWGGLAIGPRLPIHLSGWTSLKNRCPFEAWWQGASSYWYKMECVSFNRLFSWTKCGNCGGWLYHRCRSNLIKKCQLVKKPRGIVHLTTSITKTLITPLTLTKLGELCFHVPFIVCFYHVYITSYKSFKLHKDFMNILCP